MKSKRVPTGKKRLEIIEAIESWWLRAYGWRVTVLELRVSSDGAWLHSAQLGSQSSLHPFSCNFPLGFPSLSLTDAQQRWLRSL